jgi:hypothetical protein
MRAEVSYDGINYREFRSGETLRKRADLRFYPLHNKAYQYTVYWQITNTGTEASRVVGGLRGNFERSDIEKGGKKEGTEYAGEHYIQCFIVRNGTDCFAVSKPFVVRIG